MIEQKILYLDKTYTILSAEQEYIIHPAALGIIPISADALQYSYTCNYQINDYQLFLNTIVLYYPNDKNTDGPLTQEYSLNHFAVSYNGAILIGSDLTKEYRMKDNQITCFSYKNVYELVFDDGNLVTTVDQSKAMLKIRRNIDLGLRSLAKGRDKRVITRFLNSSLVGDYRPFLTKYKRMRYLKEMKNDYSKNKVSFSFKN